MIQLLICPYIFIKVLCGPNYFSFPLLMANNLFCSKRHDLVTQENVHHTTTFSVYFHLYFKYPYRSRDTKPFFFVALVAMHHESLGFWFMRCFLFPPHICLFLL